MSQFVLSSDEISIIMNFCSNENILAHFRVIWASMRQNLSSRFPTKRVSKQSPQLQRLARKLKFHL